MTMFQKFVTFVLLVYVSNGALIYRDDIDTLVDYVNNYINYTNYYTLPTDNSASLTVTDDHIYEYGSYDFIIVGGGTAGSLLARRLSEISEWKVLVLEAGSDGNQFTDIPFMNLYTRNSEFNWGYKTVPQNKSCLGMANKQCVYPTGKGLGGTSIIGDSVYARGNRADFDEWEGLGLDGWGYDDVLPYFKKTEKIEIPDYEEDYHGTDGLLRVNYTYPNPLDYDAYLKASQLSGLNSLDYNGKNQIGISKFQWTVAFNTKVTAGNAFLSPILNTQNNLKVVLNAFATNIIFSNLKATGVQFVKDGKLYKAHASREVILSAGPLNSPQLLMLSGVGPKNELEELGIEVVKDLPVGVELVDHPVYVGLYIRTNLTADPGTVRSNLELWKKGLGYYTTVFSADNIAFINTKNPGVEPPNVEILTINNPTSVPPATFYNLNDNYTTVFSTFNTLTDFLVYCINLEPKSRGWLKLKSNNPADFPLINPAYLSDANDEDIQVLYESIQFILNLTKSEPLQAINATVVAQAPDCEHLREESEKDYWYCAIRSLTSTLYHPASTTKMGTSASNSVVDVNMKVHGISSLRVVDAGSMPKLVRGHPLAAIWAMAEKIADAIKEEHL
ncbi:glucose dehydrogenase [FAD, quinone]-like [Diabrotica undecimpunctata]|uniref:glucose dehydrogenase [FAD, quinone]-like n=1 Tax=Diabrotica undecimpunctata TaxID=50387 RepID=UPI003B63B5C0